MTFCAGLKHSSRCDAHCITFPLKLSMAGGVIPSKGNGDMVTREIIELLYGLASFYRVSRAAKIFLCFGERARSARDTKPLSLFVLSSLLGLSEYLLPNRLQGHCREFQGPFGSMPIEPCSEKCWERRNCSFPPSLWVASSFGRDIWAWDRLWPHQHRPWEGGSSQDPVGHRGQGPSSEAGSSPGGRQAGQWAAVKGYDELRLGQAVWISEWVLSASKTQFWKKARWQYSKSGIVPGDRSSHGRPPAKNWDEGWKSHPASEEQGEHQGLAEHRDLDRGSRGPGQGTSHCREWTRLAEQLRPAEVTRLWPRE